MNDARTSAPATPNATESFDPSKARRTGSLGTASHVACASAVLALLLSGFGFFIAVPQFMASFQQFNTPLPWLTIQFLLLPPAVVLLGCILLIAGLIVLEVLVRQHRALTLTIHLLALMATLVFAALAVVAFFLPMIQMQQSLGP